MMIKSGCVNNSLGCPLWKRNLSEFWRAKIERNRARDRRNFAKLRRAGWAVLRLWGHEVEKDLDGCVERVRVLLGRAKAREAEGS